jgi:hypothetical protein
MKRVVLAFAAVLMLAVPGAFAADHSGHDMQVKSNMVGLAHEELVDGVKVQFTIQTMSDAMKAMGMEMPKGVKETHHISVTFKDAKTGKQLTEGVVAIKLLVPDKTEQVKDLIGMHGHFGADFTMVKKGKYGVLCKFQLKDGKIRQAKFWYEAK